MIGRLGQKLDRVPHGTRPQDFILADVDAQHGSIIRGDDLVKLDHRLRFLELVLGQSDLERGALQVDLLDLRLARLLLVGQCISASRIWALLPRSSSAG